jgi:hypothetical protein
MKQQLWGFVLAVCVLAAGVRAQDPLKVAPQAYKLEFENEWVMVTRVYYGPRVKIPEHDHTARSSAYVYLNDGGPILFKHINLPYADITRKETKAGSFRVYKGVDEVHAVENPTDIPSDFLRIEFRTEPVNANSLRGRYYREPAAPGENVHKVQFENEQIRITRLGIAAGGAMEMSANTTEPALLVALTPARLELHGAKSAKIGRAKLNLEPGKTHWLGVNPRRQVKNTGANDAELLRFDFKTKPVAAPKKSHDHEHPRNGR